MRKDLPDLAIILLITTVILSLVSGENSPSPTSPQSERFFVEHTFWAFDGFYPLCTFSANSGAILKLNILSVNVDSDRPNDVYIIDLEIASTNHGTKYMSETIFCQTIRLNYTDTYNITAAKHPFYSSVRISGDITVCHNSAPLTTNSPSSMTIPTLDPSITSTQQSGNLANTNSSEPALFVLEFSLLMIPPLFIFVLSIAVTVRARKTCNAT